MQEWEAWGHSRKLFPPIALSQSFHACCSNNPLSVEQPMTRAIILPLSYQSLSYLFECNHNNIVQRNGKTRTQAEIISVCKYILLTKISTYICLSLIMRALRFHTRYLFMMATQSTKVRIEKRHYGAAEIVLFYVLFNRNAGAGLNRSGARLTTPPPFISRLYSFLCCTKNILERYNTMHSRIA